MKLIRLTKENDVAKLTLQNPPVNALSTALLHELDAALTELKADRAIKAVIVHGEGRFFAAGADIKEFTKIESKDEFAALARLGQRVFLRIERFHKPFIAAIHGAALGGGLELAMACHLRLATEDAKLGLPELTLGLIPGFAGTQRLPRLVGKAKALEMIVTGEPITGKEAKMIGLVNAVHREENLLDAARALAEKITDKSSVNVKMILELLQYDDFDKGMTKEAELFAHTYETEDSREGIRAFIEKRKPQFKNR